MSQENFKVVQEAVAALNQRDLDAYVACCADDVRLLPPTAAVEGAYEGRSGIRRFFADIQDAVPDFRLDVEPRGSSRSNLRNFRQPEGFAGHRGAIL